MFQVLLTHSFGGRSAQRRVLKWRVCWRFFSSPVKEDSDKHSPYGDYSLATKGVYDVFKEATPLISEGLQLVLDGRKQRGTSPKEPLTIADIGTADGGSSIPLLNTLISQVRGDKYSSKAPIRILYEDQLGNDWNRLFRNINGCNPSLHPINNHKYYLEMHKDVYPMAIGTSFYNQFTPDDSVDLAFASTTFHWISSKPCAIPDALHPGKLTIIAFPPFFCFEKIAVE